MDIIKRRNYICKMKMFSAEHNTFRVGENTHTRWTLYANWEAKTTRTKVSRIPTLHNTISSHRPHYSRCATRFGKALASSDISDRRSVVSIYHICTYAHIHMNLHMYDMHVLVDTVILGLLRDFHWGHIWESYRVSNKERECPRE